MSPVWNRTRLGLPFAGGRVRRSTERPSRFGAGSSRLWREKHDVFGAVLVTLAGLYLTFVGRMVAEAADLTALVLGV